MVRPHSQGSLAQKTQGALMPAESSGSPPRMLWPLLGRAQAQGRPRARGLGGRTYSLGFNIMASE